MGHQEYSHRQYFLVLENEDAKKNNSKKCVKVLKGETMMPTRPTKSEKTKMVVKAIRQ